MQIVVKKSACQPAEWDRFAQDAGASFRCAYRANAAWQFEFHLLHALKRLEIFEIGPGGTRKIGQCAVGIGRRRRVFADSLQIAPDRLASWPQAMAAVLRHLGRGEYVYGSAWSIEPCRHDELSAISGTDILEFAPTNIDVVDFALWEDFSSYLMATSRNVRRNIAKSAKANQGAHTRFGRDLDLLFKLQGARISTYSHKNLLQASKTRLLRSLYRSAVLWPLTEFGAIVGDGSALAAYGGIRFGRNTFYMEGGSRRPNHGAAWRLLMEAIERAWQISDGRGLFVMGSDDRTQVGDSAWDGLAHSRRQCRIRCIETSTLRFRYE